MELKLSIPDYLSIKDWKHFNSLELDSQVDKMINFISYISDLELEQVRSLTPADLQTIYHDVLESLGDTDPTFFPIIEIDGKLYGYSSISKMTLGEYVDLERLTKNSIANIEEIMAILYRPIKTNKLNGVQWAVKNKYKTGTGNVENLFKYYTLEKYDSSVRTEQADIMKNLPMAFATGALSFFLVLANTSLLGSNLSLLNETQEEKMTLTDLSKKISMPIGDGLQQFLTYQKVPSLTSPEILASLI